MRFSLMHLDDEDRSDEAYLVVPGGPEKTVFAVPAAGLHHFLPLLAQATRDVPEAVCRHCGGDLIGRAAEESR